MRVWFDNGMVSQEAVSSVQALSFLGRHRLFQHLGVSQFEDPTSGCDLHLSEFCSAGPEQNWIERDNDRQLARLGPSSPKNATAILPSHLRDRPVTSGNV